MGKNVNMNNNWCVRLYANNPRTGARIFTKFDIQELNLSTNLNSQKHFLLFQLMHTIIKS
jgi:hypothetical protein